MRKIKNFVKPNAGLLLPELGKMDLEIEQKIAIGNQ